MCYEIIYLSIRYSYTYILHCITVYIVCLWLCACVLGCVSVKKQYDSTDPDPTRPDVDVTLNHSIVFFSFYFPFFSPRYVLFCYVAIPHTYIVYFLLLLYIVACHCHCHCYGQCCYCYFCTITASVYCILFMLLLLFVMYVLWLMWLRLFFYLLLFNSLFFCFIFPLFFFRFLNIFLFLFV